jgi:hypothetical protein
VLPTVATDVFDDAQEPPVVVLLKLIVLPAHTTDEPVIVPALGSGLTVTTAVTLIPLTVYEITAVPPDTPLTTPVLPAVATVVLPLLQLPPLAALLRLVLLPTHTVSVPVMDGTVSISYCIKPCVSI